MGLSGNPGTMICRSALHGIPAKLGCVLALAGMVSCLAPIDAPRVSQLQQPASPAGGWVLHIDGGPYRDVVEAVQVDTTPGDSVWDLVSLPTRGWAGDTVPPLTAGVTVGRRLNGQVVWALPSPGGQSALMTWRVIGDTIFGQFTTTTGGVIQSYPLAGVRSEVKPILLPPPQGPGMTVPMVLLRLDDLPTSDTGFVPHMLMRGLYGELSIPTALLPVQDHASWADVERWAAEGFGVAAHSVHHTAIQSDEGFIAEVVRALDGLASRGYSTQVFVQPGTWQGETDFDSTAKLRTWRGALFRTYTRVFEAYVRPPPVQLPLPDSVAQGLSHLTISDGATETQILNWWQRAQRSNTFTVFLIHSARLPTASSLDWFLDSVSSAIHTHRIRLARTSADALAP